MGYPKIVMGVAFGVSEAQFFLNLGTMQRLTVQYRGLYTIHYLFCYCKRSYNIAPRTRVSHISHSFDRGFHFVLYVRESKHIIQIC